jgi:DNA helicase HerA-like ATPase
MEYESRRYVTPISMTALPRPVARSLFIGRIAGGASKAFLEMDSITEHLILLGGTGAGKTTASMIIAEECLMRNVAVLVLDVSKKWSHFASKCDSENMLKKYHKFGMESPLSFVINETEISGDNINVRINSLIENGTLHFLNVVKLTQDQFNEFVCNVLRQLIQFARKGAKRLHTLVIIDDAYKLSPRFGGNAVAVLEEARSRLRWSDVGLVLVTHSLTDFTPFGFGNIGTEIWFRTSQEEDSERARKRFGPEYATCLSNMRTGEGMVAKINCNYGRPWFVEFRPLYHKP